MHSPSSVALALAALTVFAVAFFVAHRPRIKSKRWFNLFMGVAGATIPVILFGAVFIPFNSAFLASPTENVQQMVFDKFPAEDLVAAAGLPKGTTLSYDGSYTPMKTRVVNFRFVVPTDDSDEPTRVHLACEDNLPDLSSSRYRSKWQPKVEDRIARDLAEFPEPSQCRVDATSIIDVALHDVAADAIQREVTTVIKDNANAERVDGPPLNQYANKTTRWEIDGTDMACEGTLPTRDALVKHLDTNLPHLWNDTMLDEAVEEFNVPAKVKVKCTQHVTPEEFSTL